MEYNFKEIEAKWQRRWQEEETYRVEADPTRPKFYVLDMFPYFGCGSARRTPAGLYRFGHLLALQTALRLQRTSSDGLRRFRPACRTVRHSDGAAPRRNDRTEHRPLPGTARQDRLLVRLAP